MGLRTRIDETIARLVGAAHVGNALGQPELAGALVGPQPLGGEGLSGNGPKAGGASTYTVSWPNGGTTFLR